MCMFFKNLASSAVPAYLSHPLLLQYFFVEPECACPCSKYWTSCQLTWSPGYQTYSGSINQILVDGADCDIVVEELCSGMHVTCFLASYK